VTLIQKEQAKHWNLTICFNLRSKVIVLYCYFLPRSFHWNGGERGSCLQCWTAARSPFDRSKRNERWEGRLETDTYFSTSWV